MPRKDKRKTISAKLHREQDADLIYWFDNLKNGDKNDQVKSVLRVGLGLPVPERVSQQSNLMPVIDDLKRKILDLESTLHEATVRPANATMNPQALNALRDDIKLEMYNQLQEVATHINKLYGDVAKIMTSGMIAPSPSPVVDTAQATEEQIEKRKRNLSKGW